MNFICNPLWPEIINSIHSCETAKNRPDVVFRVFQSKIKVFTNLITKKQIFWSGRKIFMHCRILVKTAFSFSEFISYYKRLSKRYLSSINLKRAVQAERNTGYK